MRCILGILTGVMLAAPIAVASDEDAVLGRWAADDSILDVRRDGDGLAMVIVALLNPEYSEGEGVGVPGQPRHDLNNPDALLRDRPILGMNLLSAYRFDDGRWQGKIYDPESGKTYSSRMQVNGDGDLEMRGYIGAPMFGRTQTFVPASRCGATIVAMLKSAEITGVC